MIQPANVKDLKPSIKVVLIQFGACTGKCDPSAKWSVDGREMVRVTLYSAYFEVEAMRLRRALCAHMHRVFSSGSTSGSFDER